MHILKTPDITKRNNSSSRTYWKHPYHKPPLTQNTKKIHRPKSALGIKQARLCQVGQQKRKQPHIPLSSGTLCRKQQETTLPRALYRPGQDSSAQNRLVELHEFDYLQGEKTSNKTDSPSPEGTQQYTQHYATATHAKERASSSVIFHHLLQAPGRVTEKGTERCFAEVLHTGYLQYTVHLRAKIQQGRSQTVASPLYAINTYLMTTNAWILCNESKTARICGREDSLSHLIQL